MDKGLRIRKRNFIYFHVIYNTYNSNNYEQNTHNYNRFYITNK